LCVKGKTDIKYPAYLACTAYSIHAFVVPACVYLCFRGRGRLRGSTRSARPPFGAFSFQRQHGIFGPRNVDVVRNLHDVIENVDLEEVEILAEGFLEPLVNLVDAPTDVFLAFLPVGYIPFQGFFQLSWGNG
jgi:hypothetical protein